MTNLSSTLKSRDITLPTKVCLVRAVVLPIVTYRCENWTIKTTALKNWCFRIVVLEKTLESPSNCKEIKPVNPKGNQPLIFIWRTDAEAPIFRPPDAKNLLIGKDPDAGKDWRQKEKRMTVDEMVGWHHWLSGHEFEQAPGGGEGQESLLCRRPWGHKGSNMMWVTEQQQSNKIRTWNYKHVYIWIRIEHR